MPTPVQRLTDIAESLGGCVVAERVPMFAPSEDGQGRLTACVVVSLPARSSARSGAEGGAARETTIVRPTFRQAARDAEDWIAAQRID